MEDPAEIAALATEFISSLDNLPHEVSHLLKEIEHKDAKVQDMHNKIRTRELQLRQILVKANGGQNAPPDSLSDADALKVQRLADKIRADYVRADEWSKQNEKLGVKLWQSVHSHNARLQREVAKVSPIIISNTANSLAGSGIQTAPVSGLPSALGALINSDGQMHQSLQAVAAGMVAARNSAAAAAIAAPGLKRKATAISSPTTTPSASTSTVSAAARAVAAAVGASSGVLNSRGGRIATPTSEVPPALPNAGASTPTDRSLSGPRGPRKGGRGGRMGGMGGSTHASSAAAAGGVNGRKSKAGTPSAGGLEDGVEEMETDDKDETLYCFCQRVSFGEMIGCDADDCKFEWFHIGCVGVTKPLPQTWYCDDCSPRHNKKKKK